ncbi:MAG: penicillin acylase family protein, partial [Variovorax sp.]|nr:penicillin acylase family protein [Variovorax sp.]
SGLARAGHDALLKMAPGVVPLNQLWWTLPQLLRANDEGLLGGMTWQQACALALERAAASFDERPWGAHHPVALAHPLSGMFPEHAARLDPPGASVGGDNDTVLANGCQSAGGLKAVYGAVARYVFDVGRWDQSRWVVFGGVSGDPGSAHYADQHSLWAAGDLVPMVYDWALVAAGSACTVLHPAATTRPVRHSRTEGARDDE